MDELTNLKRVRNKEHVNKLVENFRHEDSLYIVTEYCEDGDLGKLLRFYAQEKLYLTEDQTLEFAMQIAKGLAELHAVNLIHKDIKPE